MAYTVDGFYGFRYARMSFAYGKYVAIMAHLT